MSRGGTKPVCAACEVNLSSLLFACSRQACTPSRLQTMPRASKPIRVRPTLGDNNREPHKLLKSETQAAMKLIVKTVFVTFMCPSWTWADWPQFRGPNGQGHSNARVFPLHWSERDNVAWKVPIPGTGWSSPVI